MDTTHDAEQTPMPPLDEMRRAIARSELMSEGAVLKLRDEDVVGWYAAVLRGVTKPPHKTTLSG